MEKVKIEKIGQVRLVTLSNGVTNPVDIDLVDNLLEVLHEVRQDAKGVVLTGGEKFFSIGLNLPKLIKLDRNEMTQFWDRFTQLCYEIYALPLPSGAAIRGHAPAAGTIFALACDYRYIAEGKKMMGVNEIKLGIPTPYIADLMLRQIVGDRIATEMMYCGEFSLPEQSLQSNLVDMVLPQESVIEAMLEKITSIAAYESEAFKIMKSVRTADIREKFEKNSALFNEQFVDCWFNGKTQTLLDKAAEKF